MPENNNPIYTRLPNVKGVAISAANTKSDGAGTIGTDLFIVFTGGANGSFLQEIQLTPTASVAATATTATVIRVFITSAASGAVTSANCWLVKEFSVAAQTADHSTNAIFPIRIPINMAIPPAYNVLVSTHAAPAANTAWQALGKGGDY